MTRYNLSYIESTHLPLTHFSLGKMEVLMDDYKIGYPSPLWDAALTLHRHTSEDTHTSEVKATLFFDPIFNSSTMCVPLFACNTHIDLTSR